jgi:hypothetical protein
MTRVQQKRFRTRVMATTRDLEAFGFQPSTVALTQLNIEHLYPLGLGPFCV